MLPLKVLRAVLALAHDAVASNVAAAVAALAAAKSGTLRAVIHPVHNSAELQSTVGRRHRISWVELAQPLLRQ
jgi:hypothetical protein